MQIVSTLLQLRQIITGWRREGARIAFVPTMGNLHAGHFALLNTARVHGTRSVVSIFVNPTQFSPNEDFASYPRTEQADAEELTRRGCDLLFLPEVETMYPLGTAAAVQMQVPGLFDTLCGEFRPGHFAGVASAVTRLFNMVQPDVAVFGRKDLQQFQVIRHLVQDLALPIELIGAPTLREPSGLAMSSRNQYLTAEERERAAEIHRVLRTMLSELEADVAPLLIEADARSRLSRSGFQVEYAVLRSESALAAPFKAPAHDPVALIAARLGKARLIDNLSSVQDPRSRS